MENIQVPLLVRILTTKKLITSKILEYFGYSHQNVYLLYCLCTATRKTFSIIQQDLKYFFEGNRYTWDVYKEEMDWLITTNYFNGPLSDFVDINIIMRLEKNKPMKDIFNIKRLSMIKHIKMQSEISLDKFLDELKHNLSHIKRVSPTTQIDVILKAENNPWVLGNLPYGINLRSSGWKAGDVRVESETGMICLKYDLNKLLQFSGVKT